MIQRLKNHTVEEIKKEVKADYGFDIFAELFEPIIKHPLPPSDEEIINKINEIVDYLNQKEELDEVKK